MKSNWKKNWFFIHFLWKRSSKQGSDGIKNQKKIFIREVNQNLFFYLWFTWANHFIFDSDIFWFTFEANESHWFILIHFRSERIALIHFDSLWFTIHFDFYSFWFAIQFDFIHFDSAWFWFAANLDSPVNHDSSAKQKSNRGRWIVIHSLPNHGLIRFRIKSESKWIANQAGPNPVSKK